MVIAGSPSSSAIKTEIIDLEGSNTCADLEDFTTGLYGAVGGIIQGMPIVCGGFTGIFSTQNKCYKFIKGKWEDFTTMQVKVRIEYQVDQIPYLYESPITILLDHIWL